LDTILNFSWDYAYVRFIHYADVLQQKQKLWNWHCA